MLTKQAPVIHRNVPSTKSIPLTSGVQVEQKMSEKQEKAGQLWHRLPVLVGEERHLAEQASVCKIKY